MTSDLKERAVRLRKEASGIKQVAMTLSFDEDRELFLQHATALEAEAAFLELQASRNEPSKQAVLAPSD